MWSWSWEHDKSLNKGQQDLTKLNTMTSSMCGRFESCKILFLALVGIAHQMRSMLYYGFMTFLSKQILQVLWIEMIGFLSQNYIIPHNNRVNMIVLLEYFPTSINTCIWNKLYASLYLKDVISMSLFEVLNTVWFVWGFWGFMWVYFLSDQNFILNSIVGSWGKSCTNHR